MLRQGLMSIQPLLHLKHHTCRRPYPSNFHFPSSESVSCYKVQWLNVKWQQSIMSRKMLVRFYNKDFYTKWLSAPRCLENTRLQIWRWNVSPIPLGCTYITGNGNCLSRATTWPISPIMMQFKIADWKSVWHHHFELYEALWMESH